MRKSINNFEMTTLGIIHELFNKIEKKGLNVIFHLLFQFSKISGGRVSYLASLTAGILISASFSIGLKASQCLLQFSTIIARQINSNG